ncbi:MAG: dephospho-CoA kinase [Myxococcales bacterium]|nr:dephospho-CoA kinase [Myxococcales bacterium]MCB9669375.1 dephospho-CoA kinase [Alphaproteobacteria bacterium]MCB9690360.1 dephospho-CoA kinase [Alphaproteobacteria bacterium]
MRIVGLTGGIATGKSSVGRILTGLGVEVIDADRVAREVVEPGQPTLAALVQALGPEILDADGRLDRPAMREAIANDPEVKATLDRITHPAIRTAIAQRLVQLGESGAEAAVVDAALMVETGSHALYPQVIVVSCHPDTQLERLIGRDGMAPDAARRLVATQMPLAEKERYATVVVRNDGTPEELEAAVRAAWAELTS